MVGNSKIRLKRNVQTRIKEILHSTARIEDFTGNSKLEKKTILKIANIIQGSVGKVRKVMAGRVDTAEKASSESMPVVEGSATQAKQLLTRKGAMKGKKHTSKKKRQKKTISKSKV